MEMLSLEKELKEDIDASSRVQLLVIKAYGKDDANSRTGLTR